MNPIANSTEPGDSQKILDLVNSGLIRIDAEGTILLWNNWVASHSGIPAEIALSHPLETLLGDELSPTFKAAFQSALACKFPVILSNALHHSPLPLYPLPLTRQRQERIQQSITITPIVTNNKSSCLIQIVDASTWVRRENVLKLQSEQQKYISQQLQESGERLRVLFEQAAVGVAEIDTMTGRFLRANHKYGEILGYSAEEMLALDFMTITHPDDLAPDLAQMERLKQGDIHEFTLEKRSLHKDGSIVWIDLTVSPLWTQGGTPTRHMAIVKDITERKQMEAELAQGAGWRRAILDHAAQAIIATTSNGIIQTFNPAAEQMLGYRAEDMIGKMTLAVFHDPEEVMERAKIFSQELGVQIEPGFEVLIAKSRKNLPNKYEWTHIRKNGTRLTVLLSISALRNASGSITGFLGLAVDITERKKVEDKLSQFKYTLDQTLDCIFMFREDNFRFIYVNNGAQKQVGYTEAELLKMTPLDIKPEFTLERFRQMVQPLIDGTQPSLNFQSIHRHKNGQDIPVDIFLQFMWEKVRQKHFIAIVRDITERKAAEIEIRTINENLERLVAERTNELHERLKEVTCLYEIHHDTELELSVSHICQQILEHLIPAMQFPGIATAMIELDNERYISKGFHNQHVMHELHSEFNIGNRICGQLRVFYSEDKPFLQQEQSLIDTVTSVLKNWLEREHLERSLVFMIEDQQYLIGQELHDNLGQQIAAINYQAHALKKKMIASGNTDTATIADSISVQAQNAVMQCKYLARGLLPIELETIGLIATLREFASRIEAIYKITCDFMCREETLINDTDIALNLYRITQEASNNAMRHGGAQHLTISLTFKEGNLRLSICDDGCGFTDSDTTRESGMGIKIMRYRARKIGAILEIRPRAEGGTELWLEMRML